MNARLISDLHLEFYTREELMGGLVSKMLPPMESDSENILILAGDMCTLKKKDSFEYFLDIVCNRFKYVMYVYGNHEYYKSNYPAVEKKRYFVQYPNLFVMNDKKVEIDDCIFIGATLWADCDKENPTSMFDIEQYMNDFRLIRTGTDAEPWKRKFKVIDMLKTHYKSKQFIIECLKEASPDKQAVIITHHAPSFKSVSEQFKGSNVNGAYASDLSDIMLDYEPSLWVHGHMHNSSDYFIGKTRIVCNPRGYPTRTGSCENANYDSKLVLTF